MYYRCSLPMLLYTFRSPPHIYKYVTPRKSEEIFAYLKELELQEAELMTKILG